MKISKRHPVILPDYKWDGSAYDWTTIPITRVAPGDLPIAYLVSQLEAMDFTILYVGLQANRPTFPIRRPNILILDPSIEYPDFTSEPWLSRVDALGLIIAEGNWLTIWNADGSGFLFFPHGIPTRTQTTPQEGLFLFALDQYAGARIMLLQEMPQPFIIDGDPNYYYTAQIGSEEFCLAAGTLGAGTDTIEDSINTGLNLDAFVSEYYTFIQDDELPLIYQHIENNFDRFRCYYRKYLNQPTSAEIELGVSCYIGGESGANGVTYGDTGVFVTVNNQSEVDTIRSAQDVVAGWLNSEYHRVVDVADLPGYDAILTFFEED